MPSPFPGMDPYLEDDKHWPAFHNQLAHCLYQMLLPGLMDRYRARIAQRHYFTEQALFTSVIREEHLEQFIEIRQRSDGRMVTLIDIVSPANKNSATGKQMYLDKRREARAGNSNIVQIELVVPGQPLLDYSREGLVDWDYAVTVTRATQPDRFEIYTATLQKRLPRFRLPLAADDRDTVIDLQAAFARSFDQGDFLSQIDYAKDPVVRMSEEQRKWIDERLREQKIRK
jgi:hypothetical protein